MTLRETLLPVLLLAGLFSGGPVGIPAAPDKGPMVKYSTAKVRLWTDAGKARAKEVMEDIAFMAKRIDAFFRSFALRAKKDNPIRIHLYIDPKDFAAARSREHTVGPSRYAFFSLNNNRIIALYGDREGPGRAARAALYRECARWIVHGYFSNPPPAWFDEGLSCYFEGLEFDEYRNLITDCGAFSRVERMKYTPLPRGGALARFFDERPFDYAYNKRSGANRPGGAFSNLAWAVVYFYVHAEDEAAQALFRKFMRGMSTGRERSKMILEDLRKRRVEFEAFFKQDLQAPFRLYADTVRLREAKRYKEALAAVLELLHLEPDNRAGVRLAGEVSFEAGRYMISLAFWRRLAALDPREIHYWIMICRALTEAGRERGDARTLEDAVKAGRDAVKRAGKRNPDCLAALAMALHAKGDFREALACMRMAESLGGENVEALRERVRAYSRDVIEQDRERRKSK